MPAQSPTITRRLKDVEPALPPKTRVQHLLREIERGTAEIDKRLYLVLMERAAPTEESILVNDSAEAEILARIREQKTLLQHIMLAFAEEEWDHPDGQIREAGERAVEAWSAHRVKIVLLNTRYELGKQAFSALYERTVAEALQPDEEKIHQWITDLAEHKDAEERKTAIRMLYRDAWAHSPEKFFALIQTLGEIDMFLVCLGANQERLADTSQHPHLAYLLYRPVMLEIEFEKECEAFVREVEDKADPGAARLQELLERYRERLHTAKKPSRYRKYGIKEPPAIRHERAGLSELFPRARQYGDTLSDTECHIEGKFALTQTAIQELVTEYFGKGKTAVTTAGTTAGFNAAARAAISQMGTSCDIFMGPGEYEPMVEGIDRVRTLPLPQPDYSDKDLIDAIRKKVETEARIRTGKKKKKASQPHRMIFTVSTLQRMGGKRTDTDAVYAAIQELNAQYAESGLVIDLWVDASHSVNPVTKADLVFYSKGHTIPGRGFAVVDSTKKTNAFLLSRKGLGEHTQEMHGLGCIVAALACMSAKGAFNLHDYLRFPAEAKKHLSPEALNKHILDAETYLFEHCPLLREHYQLCISHDVRQSAQAERDKKAPWRFSSLLRLQPRIGKKGVQNKWIDLPALEERMRQKGVSMPIFSTVRKGVDKVLWTLLSHEADIVDEAACIADYLDEMDSANVLWSPFERDQRELTEDRLEKSEKKFKKKKRQEEFRPRVLMRMHLAFLQHVLTQDSLRMFVDIKDLINPRYLMDVFRIMEETLQEMQTDGTLYLPPAHPVYAAFEECTTRGTAVQFRKMPGHLRRKLEHRKTPDRAITHLGRRKSLEELMTI